MTIENDYNCGVYSISSPSGKMYIGSSRNIKDRWSAHRLGLKKGTHHSKALQRAYDKYEGNLEYKILLVCEQKDLYLYEQQYLDFYKPAYNCSPMAGGLTGYQRPEEVKKKISLTLKGRPKPPGRKLSEETKRKIGLASKGHVVTAEMRKKISDGNKGEKNYMYGKAMAEETKQKISEKLIGRTKSKESVEKSRIARVGAKRSEEQRKRMSEGRIQARLQREALRIVQDKHGRDVDLDKLTHAQLVEMIQEDE